MRPFNPVFYAKGVLMKNAFHEFELPELMGGKTNNPPHGLPPEVWRQASEEVGFTYDNLENDGQKFWLKNKYGGVKWTI